jgi:hypothetical protein
LSPNPVIVRETLDDGSDEPHSKKRPDP